MTLLFDLRENYNVRRRRPTTIARRVMWPSSLTTEDRSRITWPYLNVEHGRRVDLDLPFLLNESGKFHFVFLKEKRRFSTTDHFTTGGTQTIQPDMQTVTVEPGQQELGGVKETIDGSYFKNYPTSARKTQVILILTCKYRYKLLLSSCCYVTSDKPTASGPWRGQAPDWRSSFDALSRAHMVRDTSALCETSRFAALPIKGVWTRFPR